MIRTLGIDLASRPQRTVYCAIQWYADMALVETPVRGADDEALLAAMEGAAWTGIDAPFGWPAPFARAVSGYEHLGQWPSGLSSDDLRLRETDRFVRDVLRAEREVHLTPLSVSSNWIAMCAWRCAELLRQYHERTGQELDRIAVPLTSGMDGPPDEPRGTSLVAERGVVEVYPSAALAMWGMPHRGNRAGPRTSPALAQHRRQSLIAQLEEVTAGWLVLATDVHRATVASDHCLDAFVAALVAFAAATDCTIKPTLAQRGLAQAEGWIHLPGPDCLQHLARGGV